MCVDIGLILIFVCMEWVYDHTLILAQGSGGSRNLVKVQSGLIWQAQQYLYRSPPAVLATHSLPVGRRHP